MTLLRCLAALMVGAVLFVACGDEEVVGGCDPCPPPQFESLTQRWHVLHNLQLAYNERETARVDELLDQDFTFHPSSYDVSLGLPPQWGRTEEFAITTMLFDPSLAVPGRPTCRSIRVDLKFEDGVTWVDTIPPAFPAETWHMTTVYYDCIFEMDPDVTYVTVLGSRAQLTVRNIGTEDAPQWRLVEWRDLGGGTLLSAMSTQPTTWGSVKGLYYVYTKEDVIGGLERAYNNRRTYQLDRLLDVNFTFFLSPGDVGRGLPEQWGRPDEMSMSRRLFDPNLDDPNYPTCRSVEVDINYESGVQWVAVIPESAPAETWYTTTVDYDFAFEMVPDVTYLAVPGARAQLTVRNIGTDDAPKWRLIEWRDLGDGTLLSATSTQPTTWSSIKALYL